MLPDHEKLLLNCFPIRPIVEEATIHVASTPLAGFRKISRARITQNRVDRTEVVYWSVSKAEGARVHKIHSGDSLFRDLLNDELSNHFAASDLPHRRSFLGGTEVWVPVSGTGVGNVQEYGVFILRILSPKSQYAATGWNLLLSYGGRRLTHPKTAEDINVPENAVRQFLHNLDIIRSKDFEGSIPDAAHVVINHDVSKILGIDRRPYRDKNKYKTFYTQIIDFYSTRLKVKANRHHICRS